MRSPTIINVTAPTEYVTRTVNITETRAPTDESVRLLKEMEEAARNKVDQSIRLDGNDFKCVVEIMQDAMSDQRVAYAVFELNGKRMTAEHRVSRRDDNPAALAIGIRDEIAKTIATAVIGAALSESIRRAYP